MPIVNEEKWNNWVEKNDDPYGKACVDVAREVMAIIDRDAPEALDTHTLICDADKTAKAGGITGFMAGCVAQMVSTRHSRGDEFRIAWNAGYDVSDEPDKKKGAVNPAIMTVSPPEADHAD